MTVAKLRELLVKYPDTMDVFIPTPDGEFEYGPVEEVDAKEIPFRETPDGEELSRDTVLVLSDI